MPKWLARWVFGEWKWLSDWYIIQKKCWRAISGFMGPSSAWMRTPQVLTEGWYIIYIYIDVFIPQGMFVTRSSYSDRRLGQKSCTLLAMGADFASRPDSATFDSFHSQILLIFMFGHVLTLFQWNSVSISFWFDSDRSSIFPGWGLLICLHCYLQLSIRILRTIPKVTFLQILAQYSYWDRLLWPVGACMISYKICMHIMYIIYV